MAAEVRGKVEVVRAEEGLVEAGTEVAAWGKVVSVVEGWVEVERGAAVREVAVTAAARVVSAVKEGLRASCLVVMGTAAVGTAAAGLAKEAAARATVAVARARAAARAMVAVAKASRPRRSRSLAHLAAAMAAATVVAKCTLRS